MTQRPGGTGMGNGRRGPNRRHVLQTGMLVGAALAMPAVRTAWAAKGPVRFCNVESNPKNVASLKQAAADYEKETGVQVEIETVVGTTLWEKVTTAIKTGRPYDIIDFAQPTQTILLAREGQLTPVTGLINDIGIDDFNPNSLLTYNGEQWYFPFLLNLCNLYYRKDWLEAAKLDVPKTWDEFAAAAKAFNDPGQRRSGTSLAYSPGTTPWGNSGFLWAGGVEFYDDQWNVLLDGPDIKPKLTRTLQFLLDINPYNAPGQFSMSFPQISTNFVSNVAGIASGAGLLVESIDAKYPDLEDKFVAGPYPAPDGGKGTVVFGGKGLGIGKSDNAEQAIDFVRWLVKSGRLIDFQLQTPFYAQPAQYSTYDDPRWVNNPRVKKHPNTVKTLRSYLDPAVTNINSVQQQGPEVTANQGMIVNEEVILHMYQNVLTKTMSISDAIDDAAAKVRSFTKKT